MFVKYLVLILFLFKFLFFFFFLSSWLSSFTPCFFSLLVFNFHSIPFCPSFYPAILVSFFLSSLWILSLALLFFLCSFNARLIVEHPRWMRDVFRDLVDINAIQEPEKSFNKIFQPPSSPPNKKNVISTYQCFSHKKLEWNFLLEGCWFGIFSTCKKTFEF